MSPFVLHPKMRSGEAVKTPLSPLDLPGFEGARDARFQQYHILPAGKDESPVMIVTIALGVVLAIIIMNVCDSRSRKTGYVMPFITWTIIGLSIWHFGMPAVLWILAGLVVLNIIVAIEWLVREMAQARADRRESERWTREYYAKRGERWPDDPNPPKLPKPTWMSDPETLRLASGQRPKPPRRPDWVGIGVGIGGLFLIVGMIGSLLVMSPPKKLPDRVTSEQSSDGQTHVTSTGIHWRICPKEGC
jgi:hypothetical protein